MSQRDTRKVVRHDTANTAGAGIVIGRVKRVIDVEYNQQLEVEILHEGAGSDGTPGQIVTCKYMSPFYGVTGEQYVDKNNDYNGTQKSYGMWVPTPDIGTQVLVLYIQGNPKDAYWIGCIQDRYKNFMLPGYAATGINVEYGSSTRVPTVEFNPKTNDRPNEDPSNVAKPAHKYMVDALVKQGLINDDIRGITSTSARRETPSKVWGVSTGGPIDKTGPTGPVGTIDDLVEDAPVSRLGGSSFVMDDGDSTFTRKTKAAEGPPLYGYIFDDNSGDPTVPHNELIRLRTRTGHQILLHNSEDLIYIGNAAGTAWVELTSNGKIDIYAADSISIHSEADVNIKADRDINMEAGRNINLKAMTGRMQVETALNFNLIVGQDGFITTKGNVQVNTTGFNNFTSAKDTNINSANNNLTATTATNIKATTNNFTASGVTNMNSTQQWNTATTFYTNPGAGSAVGVAAKAIASTVASLATVLPTIKIPNFSQSAGEVYVQSILPRVPSVEPWPHHENLDPMQFLTELTDRETAPAYTVPDAWNTYSTTLDTFKQGRSE